MGKETTSTGTQANAYSTLNSPFGTSGDAQAIAGNQIIGPQKPSAHNQQVTMTTAIFHTNKGDFTIELFPQMAPNTVANFVKLAQSGFYDGVKFHRVIPDFMIQGGDPLTKDDSQQARWGTGGPGYTFPDEIGPQNKNMAGTLAMANAGPNTNGSQFFINLRDNNFLDGKHTVFGRVVQGAEAVMGIASTQTGAQDRPVEPIVIKNISLK